MFFLKGKEDLGLEASLNLLDLSPRATIDDANQAYTYLHRMIDLFHRDHQTDRGDRQEDLEMLACAYEKAVSYLSDPEPVRLPSSAMTDNGEARTATDLHFTINFQSTGDDHAPEPDNPPPAETDSQTVENAIAIISRRLEEAEAALEEARQAVDAATAAVEAANQRLDKTRETRINAMIAAKSAKSRAILMEIEAERAGEEAIAVAEKARDQVTAARQAAKTAKIEADKAKEQIRQVTKAEETAAAEVVCAEDQLEKATQRLKVLAHTVVETRSRLRIFAAYDAQAKELAASAEGGQTAMSSKDPFAIDQPIADPDNSRRQIVSDLMEIENSLNLRKRQHMPAQPDDADMTPVADEWADRRQHPRLHYPDADQPLFSYPGGSVPVLDLSQAGMGLAFDAELGRSNLVRGTIIFHGLPNMNVTGRVVRQDDDGLGLRLVTRIGNHVLDQERMRLEM